MSFRTLQNDDRDEDGGDKIFEVSAEEEEILSVSNHHEELIFIGRRRQEPRILKMSHVGSASVGRTNGVKSNDILRLTQGVVSL